MSMTVAGARSPARPALRNAIAATLIMVGALTAARWLTPSRSWYDRLGRPDLEQVVPRQFGDWLASDRTPAQIVSPELEELVRIIYAQTLSRVYVNRASGRAIMLSVALGLDQARGMQFHRPEACYRTQGFVVENLHYDVVSSPFGPIKLTRFMSHTSTRTEPVSYWVRIGDRNTQTWFEKNWAKALLSMQGYSADGLMFRVSEISADPKGSFRLQDQFINDLVGTLDSAQRAVLVGSTGS